MARQLTQSASARQELARPVTGSSAASPRRDWPPMLVKRPPAYTFPEPIAKAATALSAPGFHAVATPVSGSSAAIERRLWPPMLVNQPPAYKTPAPYARP